MGVGNVAHFMHKITLFRQQQGINQLPLTLITDFELPRPFRCRVRSRHATDGQTDRQTESQTPAVIS